MKRAFPALPALAATALALTPSTVFAQTKDSAQPLEPYIAWAEKSSQWTVAAALGGGTAHGMASYTGMGGPLEELISKDEPARDSGMPVDTAAVAGKAPRMMMAASDRAPMGKSLSPAEAEMALGGPVETRTGYPPCSPGPGDDNCIQLYERGVTGSGN